MIYVVVILFGLCLLAFIFALCQRSKIKSQKVELERLQTAHQGLVKEFSALYEAHKISNENKEEADEKKSNLYNGDPVDNAINGLSNHKRN